MARSSCRRSSCPYLPQKKKGRGGTEEMKNRGWGVGGGGGGGGEIERDGER